MIFVLVIICAIFLFIILNKKCDKCRTYREDFNEDETQSDNKTKMTEFLDLPNNMVPAWGQSYGDDVDNLIKEAIGITRPMCSKSCCSQQYPPSFVLAHDEMVCRSTDTYVENPYKCRNTWQDSGCVCMTKEQREFMSSRGGNA